MSDWSISKSYKDINKSDKQNFEANFFGAKIYQN